MQCPGWRSGTHRQNTGKPECDSWRRGWTLKFGGSHPVAFHRDGTGRCVPTNGEGKLSQTPGAPALVKKVVSSLVCISLPCKSSGAPVTGFRPVEHPAAPLFLSRPVRTTWHGSSPSPLLRFALVSAFPPHLCCMASLLPLSMLLSL